MFARDGSCIDLISEDVVAKAENFRVNIKEAFINWVISTRCVVTVFTLGGPCTVNVSRWR